MKLMPSDELTAEMLRSELRYMPGTGEFIWISGRLAFNRNDDSRIGKKAGCVQNGYVWIRLGKRLFLAHRLAYLHVFGAMPNGLIVKFRNQNRADVRWENLEWTAPEDRALRDRVARKNNQSTGVLGVTYNKRLRRYVAQITVNGRHKRIGVFDDVEAARAAYARAKVEHHGWDLRGCNLVAEQEAQP